MANYGTEQVTKYMDIYSRLKTASLGTALESAKIDKGLLDYFNDVLKDAQEVPEELRNEHFRTALSRLEEGLKRYTGQGLRKE